MLPIKRLLQSVCVTNRHFYGFAAVVLLACAAVYSLALNGPLFFDDTNNLINNYSLQIRGGSFDAWRVAIVSSNAGILHRPVAMFTFALNHVVSGEFSPFALKATNLFVHLLTGGMIFHLCLVLLRAPALSGLIRSDPRLVALTAAALWLLHPLHVSTVLYAIQRMAQLSTLFVIIGLWWFTRCRLRWAAVGASVGEMMRAALWLMIIGGLAVLSKENGALLPWLIAVIEVTLFYGIWQGQRVRALVWLGWLVLLLPLLLVATVFVYSPETLTRGFVWREFSLEERVLTQGRMLWRYLGWIVLPRVSDMGFFHDDILISKGLWQPLSTGLALLAWSAVIVLTLWWRKRYPLLCFALLFYLVGHGLESTIIHLEMIFEHRNYLPSVAVLLLMAVILIRGAEKVGTIGTPLVLGGVLSVFALLLLVRTQAWTDEFTLARYNVENHPQSARANFFYGKVLFNELEQAPVLGRDEERQRDLAVASRHYFAQAYQLDPRGFAALVMLHQFDTVNFPGLLLANDWLAKLSVLADSRRLQPADISALQALVQFTATSAGEAGRMQVGSLLEQLLERFPSNPDIVILYYRYLSTQQDVDIDQLRQLLEHKTAQNPGTQDFYAYLVNYHGHDDLAATHERIRAWMTLDTRRRELPAIQRIFDN